MFRCPHCRAECPDALPPSAAHCPACGLALSGLHQADRPDSTAVNAVPLAAAPAAALQTRVETIWRPAFLPDEDPEPGSTLRAETPLTGVAPTLSLKTKTVAEPGAPRTPDAEYHLSESIGQGGMAIVYEARQASIDRTIAIKMIKPDLVDDDQFRERFLFEAAVTGDLEHPNIIPLYDVGNSEQGHPFYAMRRIRGTPWSKVITRKTLQENIAILMDVADAVAFAHSRGVVHRDLKPANVMLGDFGEVLVIDWGIAVSFAPHGKAARLSEATALGGTPAYMAPEMAAGDMNAISPQSDIYLLGAILFEILSGQPPHPGKKAREVILNAARNVIRPAQGPGEHLEIALRAMATRPGDRYPGVKEFQEAIREVQSHAESLAFSSRARDILDLARASGSYDEYAQALFTAQDALRLWEANRAAAQTAADTRLAWAGCACAKGDLDLAESLLEAGGLAGTDLAVRVRTLKDERRRLAEDKRALEQKIASEERREWQLVFSDDFAGPDFESRWEAVGAAPEWRPGELRLRGGRPQLLIARINVPGDVRLEFDCCQEGETLSDLNCFLCAPPDDDRDLLEADAYAFKIGAEGNRRTGLYRLGTPLFEQPGAPLVAGRRTRVRAERVGPRLTLTVNGHVVCDLIDPTPIQGEGRGVLGISGWFADTRYTAVRVWRLGSPLKADLLELAEKFVTRGRYETAMDLFQDVAESNAAPERLDRARRGLARAAGLRDLEEALPALQERLAAHWPAATLRLGDHGLCLSLGAQGVTDLAPLRGIPLTDLECEDNAIASLEPLRGMPLRRLICKGNAIASLEPLRGMPLAALNCGLNQITTLKPLAGMRLSALWCFGNAIASLEPLRGMPLVALACFDNPVASLEPLRGMPLQALGCAHNGLSSLAPLRGMPLVSLWCSGNGIPDLEPLRGMALTNLYCSFNRIASLEPLRGMPLASLWCDNNQIADLETLRGMPLDSLRCFGNPFTSLDPLLGRPPGDFLYDTDNRISNAELARAATAWASLPSASSDSDGARVLLALRTGDLAGLRARASVFAGRALLFVPLATTWDDAVAHSAALGGRLACAATPERVQVIQGLIRESGTAWCDAPDRPAGEGLLVGNPQRYQAHASGLSAADMGFRKIHECLELWAIQPNPQRMFPFVMEWPA